MMFPSIVNADLLGGKKTNGLKQTLNANCLSIRQESEENIRELALLDSKLLGV